MTFNTFSTTEKLAVDAVVPVSSAVATQPEYIRFIADVPTHISLNGAATQSSALIAANIETFLAMGNGASISVLADTGSPAGSAYITKVG